MSLAETAIRQMLADGESVAVEFKIKAPRPAELAERICGMANGRGGTLLIGIADATGEVVGLEKPNDAIDIVLRAARTVKPPVTLVAPGAEVRLLDGRPIVVAQVPLNDGELYQAGGVCWIRRGTHTVPMTTTEIAEHMNATGALRWETQLCPNTRLDHLDAALLERYLAFRTERSRLNLRHTPQEELLLGLNCAARDPQTGDVRPTNVGVLMFGYDPQFHIPQSEVVCVRYKDSLGAGKYVDRKIISGTPLELIDRAQEFLTTHMRVGGDIVGFKRVDLPEYPIEALREAVVNAVVHRDYSRVGEAIRVFFYADRVEVHSPGLLPPGVALEDLVAMRAPSRPRNPVLAQFLRDIPGYMERIGAGIRMMVNEMQLMGLPAPEFVEQHEFVVIFRNGQQREEGTSVPLNPRQIIGLRLIQERGSITSTDYVDATGASDRTALRELRDMVDRGLIVVRGKTRSARYYLP